MEEYIPLVAPELLPNHLSKVALYSGFCANALMKSWVLPLPRVLVSKITKFPKVTLGRILFKHFPNPPTSLGSDNT